MDPCRFSNIVRVRRVHRLLNIWFNWGLHLPYWYSDSHSANIVEKWERHSEWGRCVPEIWLPSCRLQAGILFLGYTGNATKGLHHRVNHVREVSHNQTCFISFNACDCMQALLPTAKSTVAVALIRRPINHDNVRSRGSLLQLVVALLFCLGFMCASAWYQPVSTLAIIVIAPVSRHG